MWFSHVSNCGEVDPFTTTQECVAQAFDNIVVLGIYVNNEEWNIIKMKEPCPFQIFLMLHATYKWECYPTLATRLPSLFAIPMLIQLMLNHLDPTSCQNDNELHIKRCYS